MKALKKGAEILLSVVLWAVILLAALFAFTTLATRDQNSVSSIAGFTPMIVESDSMAPTFKMGDMIIIKKCDTSKLKEGDIITFHTIINNEYALNTHRIESIQEVGDYRSYTTKGDNNQVSDTHIGWGYCWSVCDEDLRTWQGDVFPVKQHGISYCDRYSSASVLYLSGISSYNGQHQPEKGDGCRRCKGTGTC